MTFEENDQKVKEAVQTLLCCVNGGDPRDIAKIIWDNVSRDHRTLQQGFWSAMLLAQIQYADNPSDLRNEAAVKLAQKVKELAKENNFDYGLPFI